MLTTVLPWNDMCGERFGFAHQCFHLERQRCRCQTRANQITPCCWNTVKCAHTWQALSKDASPSSLLQRSCVCYLIYLFTFFIWRGMKINNQIETVMRISAPAKSRKAQDTFLLAPESLGSNKLFLFALLCNTHLFNLFIYLVLSLFNPGILYFTFCSFLSCSTSETAVRGGNNAGTCLNGAS